MKIISLISSATEIVCRLGCSESLVGISHECDYPENVCDLPVCSKPKLDIDGTSLEVDNQVKSLLQEALSIYDLNERLISELKPDIIITQSQCNVCAVSLNDVQNALKKNLGINPTIISLEPKNLSDIFRDIKYVASKLNKDYVAAKIINSFEKEIVKLKSSKVKKNTVACVEWIEPLMFAGNWVPEIVEIVGGKDLFGLKGEHSTWSKYEELFDKNPDKIIFMPCGYGIEKTKFEIKKICKMKEWYRLKAVKSDNVYIADGSQYFNRPGPRLLDSIKIMDEILNDKIPANYIGRGWQKVEL